jgi:hypothetical protein
MLKIKDVADARIGLFPHFRAFPVIIFVRSVNNRQESGIFYDTIAHLFGIFMNFKGYAVSIKFAGSC